MDAIRSVVGEPLVIAQIAKPVPGPEQVLIRTAAAGVNRPGFVGGSFV